MRALSNLDLSGPRLLDGGFATELERRGVSTNGPLWSAIALLDAPEAVLAVHQSYLEAGADVLLTGTYQASSMGFEALGFSREEAARKAAEALRTGVGLALHARDLFGGTSAGGREILTGVSLGPYGAALANGAEFTGAYGFGSAAEEFTALEAFHSARIGAVAETGADFLAFETLPKLAEARAIAAALGRWPELGACISFTCRDEVSTAYGDSVRGCAAFLDGVPQVRAAGVNCIPPGLVLGLLDELRAGTSKPLLVYPNSGEGWDAASRSWTQGLSVDWGRLSRQWLAAGAGVIGGCCRTGPEQVRAINAAVTPKQP